MVSCQDVMGEATRGIGIFQAIMGAISGILLLVGSIGIMNVLLALAADRTRQEGGSR